jgi:phosphate transport system protein
MLRDSLDSLVNLDVDSARGVGARDDEVDDINREMFDVLQEIMRSDPTTIERAIHTLSASRHLERMADLTTNISEDVVFMVEGEIVRHQPENYAEKRRKS